MATKQLVTKVWIEPGCIVCDACETACPEVFEVQDETCIIRPEALSADFTRPLTSSIIDAAEECPVDVIKYETVTADAPDEPTKEAAEGPAKAEAPESKTAKAQEQTAPAPKAKQPAEKVKPAAEQADTGADGSKKPAAAAVAADAGAKSEPAGQRDPGIAALLKAATARGGGAGIMRRDLALPDAAESWQRKDPKDLPPDARQARLMEAARKAAKAPDKDRRAVVGSAALTLGWVAFGTGLGVSVGPAFGRFMMPNVLEEPDPKVRIGPLKNYVEMPVGGVNEDFKPQGIWLIREEERIAALSIICTHLGCIPNWLPNDRKFKCPCHGSGYYYDGINFEGPTPRPLERFRVYIDGGSLVVDKSKKYQYELGQWDQPGSYIPV